MADTGEINELHIASYRRHLKIKNRSEATIDDYEDAIRRLMATYPGADLTEVTRDQVSNHLSAMFDRGLKATTVGIHFRSLRAFFNWTVAEELLDRSPMRGLGEPKPADEPVDIIPDDNIRALLKVCAGTSFEQRRDTAILRIWCEPGSPRVAEMASLTVNALDMKHDQLTIHGKGDKTRIVPFGAKTGQAIDRYLRVRARHKHARLPGLWLGGQGMAITASGLAQMLRRRCRQAGVPHVHPHQFRHTAAHHWMDAGGSEQDAMVLFGWRSSEMPRRYGRSAREERARNAARRTSLADRY